MKTQFGVDFSIATWKLLEGISKKDQEKDTVVDSLLNPTLNLLTVTSSTSETTNSMTAYCF